MTHQFLVTIYWPPEGRQRRGHGYKYLVLADTEAAALDRAEQRWAGKMGGAKKHATEIVGEADADFFELSCFPPVYEQLRGVGRN